ncbi:MAG: glycoside hydrolase family 65 protein [Planctomycetes bacterium]|nr:glycoside hydrolase family 65 protein [Planctomycetota bacterium]
MNQYLKTDNWTLTEEGFTPENHMASESLFSLGNGHFGQRANFEESYSGESLQGSYVAGVYYPDKTRVGWWKNGYPEYFAKVLNSPNWTGIKVFINDEELDLAKCKLDEFKRVLDMKRGTLARSFVATLNNGIKVRVETERFISMADKNNAAISYSVTPLETSANIRFVPFIEGDVRNEDSNYGESFWTPLETYSDKQSASLVSKTNKLDFHCAYGFTYELLGAQAKPEGIATDSSAAIKLETKGDAGQTMTLLKYVSVLSSLNHKKDELITKANISAQTAKNTGYEALLEAHTKAWATTWQNCDIRIEGDAEAQQGIRFNIFHLHQTYTGDDPRLNIGPKGFTGEKYGGATYWDTEAYCVPFFLCTAPPSVTRQLLEYRYRQLDKAIENAEKLGFTNGAALYPMVTMNGEECHNEWEITFEEIHRNGAIAYAIHNYIRHTEDKSYLLDGGLEVLIGISRFWSQRIHWSEEKSAYVMLGVTGPNEYENNINNNWYTNRIARWCMIYTLSAIEEAKAINRDQCNKILAKLSFNSTTESSHWQSIIENLHFPFDEKRGVFLQQDGYLDKEQLIADELDSSQRPINQHWSWDRILRSCFIKQADTLQGIYAFEEEFDIETIRRNFDFYEPKTVHESSLSPCIHSILACRIGRTEKAYEMYLRTSRLDLDDYNCEVHEGLHITSMAGTWMSIVEGFGGKRIANDKLHIAPIIPQKWQAFEFKISYKNCLLNIRVDQASVKVEMSGDKEISIRIYEQDLTLKPGQIEDISVQAVV